MVNRCSFKSFIGVPKIFVLMSLLVLLLFGCSEINQIIVITPKPNRPPNKPILVRPANFSSNVAVYPTLIWDCTDPDGDELTYEIHIGTDSNSLVKIASDLKQTNFTFTSELAEGTKYYWKVIAKDSKGAYTSSDTWQFTTLTTGTEAWTFTTEAPSLLTPAIQFDGTIILTDISGNVYAVSPSGQRIWKDKIENFYATVCPTIGPDGTIYFCGLYSNNSGSAIAAFNKNGKKLWEISCEGFIRSAPAVGSDGTIYVLIEPLKYLDGDTKISAVDKNGKLLWSRKIGSGFSFDPVVLSDGTLIAIHITLVSSDVIRVSKSGEVLGTLTIEGRVISPIVDRTGKVYLFVVNADLLGSLSWKLSKTVPETKILALDPRTFNYSVLHVEKAFLGFPSPAIDDVGNLYIPGIITGGELTEAKSSVYKFNTLSKAMEWIRELDGLLLSTPFVGADGKVYVTWRKFRRIDSLSYSVSEILTVLDSSGKVLKQIEVVKYDLNQNYLQGFSYFHMSPVITEEGLLILPTFRGWVKAIRTTALGYQRNCWPKYRKDYQNSGRN